MDNELDTKPHGPRTMKTMLILWVIVVPGMIIYNALFGA